MFDALVCAIKKLIKAGPYVPLIQFLSGVGRLVVKSVGRPGGAVVWRNVVLVSAFMWYSIISCNRV